MNGEFIEPNSRRSREKARRTSLVLHALSDRFTGEPFPAMSEHYHASGIPGEIGNVALPTQLRLVYTQPEDGVGYTDVPDDAA